MNSIYRNCGPLLAKVGVFSITALLALTLASCADDSKFHPKNTLTSKLFIIGSQIDKDNNLVFYVNGTDANGEPLTYVELQKATVTVTSEISSVVYTSDDALLTIDPVLPSVGNNDKILSLSLITDYSGSIEDSALESVSDVYVMILSSLPRLYEAQIINFSDTYHLEIDWTDGATHFDSLVAATRLDDKIWRNGTALYDTIGFALLGSSSVVGTRTTPGDGLIERCRPAHMMVVFSDGKENPQPQSPKLYTDIKTLADLVASSQTFTIMLGTSNADYNTLQSLAGKNGAVVQVNKPENIKSEVNQWAQSLNHIVKFTLAAETLYTDHEVVINLDNQEIPVSLPLDEFCRVAP